MLRNKCFVISITIDNKVIYLQQISVFREKKSQNDCNQENVVFYYHTIG